MRTVCPWEPLLAVTGVEATLSPFRIRDSKSMWRQAGTAIIIKALMGEAMLWSPGTRGRGGDCALVKPFDSFITWAGWCQWPSSVKVRCVDIQADEDGSSWLDRLGRSGP